MDERFYPVKIETGTIQLISVTSVLAVANKEGLNIWRAKKGYELSEQYSQETADIGREIHKYVARLLQGTAISKLEWESLSGEIKNGVRAFWRFKTETGLIKEACEKVVYNLKYGYAGTLDCLGKIGKHWVIIDWKSGERFWASHFAQVAAYHKALSIRYSNLELYVVNLNRHTGVPIVNKLTAKDSKPYWEYFLACLNLWKSTKAIEELGSQNKGSREVINSISQENVYTP